MDKKDIRPITFISSLLDSNQDWCFDFPEWDNSKCTGCGTCYLACPDSAIFQKKNGYFEADETLCKGCGVCALQCLSNCISLNPVAVRPPWLTHIA